MPSNVGLVEIFRKVWEISVPRLSAILPNNQVNRLVSSYRLTSLVLDIAVKNRLSTGVCGQGLSYVFAAPPIKYFVIFLRLSIANPNPNPNLKP